VTDLREMVNGVLAVEGLTLREAREARRRVLEACPDYPPDRIRTLHLWERRYGLSWQLDHYRTGFTESGYGVEDLVAYVVSDIQTPSERWCHWCRGEYLGTGLGEGACPDCLEELRDDRAEPYQRLRLSGLGSQEGS